MASIKQASLTKEMAQKLQRAIVQTVAYVDGFDYPLTAAEIHRYLIGIPADLNWIEYLLQQETLVPKQLHHYDNYYMLPGRQAMVRIRQQREQIAQQLWPQALHYGRLLAQLPFVRMVGVTGSLAVNNTDTDADLDYLLVTENGHLWTSRALSLLVVKLAARRDIVVCPNYFISQRALDMGDHSLYMAHEVIQMIPLSGMLIYERFRQVNRWTEQFLPNAQHVPPPFPPLMNRHYGQRLVEGLLGNRLGNRLEQWEMERKIRKFKQQLSTGDTETAFSPDWCKGHFDNHGQKTMHKFTTQLERLEREH